MVGDTVLSQANGHGRLAINTTCALGPKEPKKGLFSMVQLPISTLLARCSPNFFEQKAQGNANPQIQDTASVLLDDCSSIYGLNWHLSSYSLNLFFGFFSGTHPYIQLAAICL
jgi:hypothetical protein